MSDEQQTRTEPRKRGKGFATVPLGDAISAVKDAGKYGREHGLNDFAGYLGHTTTNSGPFRRKMAALKDWGLIERGGDRVTFTDLANEIAHPESTDQEADRIRQAFRNEPLFASIYDESAKDTELDLEFIGGRAVNGFGVAPQSKKRFAESFGESVQAANLGKLTGNGKVVLTGGADATAGDEDGEEMEDDQSPTIPAVGSGSLSGTRRTSKLTAPVLHQEWPLEHGSVTFEVQLGGPLPSVAFSEVTKVVSAIESFVKSLKPDAARGSNGAAE